MVTATEAAANARTSLAAELSAGTDWLSLDQTITFTLYQKYILPIDGFVFWVKQTTQTTIDGSLHYSTEIEQDEASTIAINTMVFTAESQIDAFQQIDPQNIYLATFDGILFAFSTQGKFYKQANMWHYSGVAVKSILQSQIINDPTQLNYLSPIVSNSLPIWLYMQNYVPPYPGFVCPIPEIYPSYLVPENAQPPYAAIHIEDTRALGAQAFLGSKLESSQLASEKVIVTTYGVNNDDIITFLNFVFQYSGDWNYIGMMNMPIIKDEKDPQPELFAIAQKKSIEFRVSYLQTSARNVARQHIIKCIVNSQASPSIAGVVVTPINAGILAVTEKADVLVAT